MTWTDKITPRRASALGSYLADTYLPIRYGRASGSCVRLNSRGTRWLWADHAIDGVDEVRLDGLKITGWEAKNEVDATGRAIAVITLTEPAEAGASVFAVGRGKPLTNPADVACDALGIPLGNMPVFRADCVRLGYVAGGSITAPITRQALAREIAASFGAQFTPARGIFYPDISSPQEIDVGAIYTQGKPYGAVVASFDFADGQAQQTVTLRAQAGDSEAITLPWVKSQRVAVAVATALAIERSGQLWQFDFTKKSKRISAGAPVSFLLAPFGSRIATVTESAYDFAATTGAAQFRLPGASSATLEHQSVRFGADAPQSVSIQRVGDDVELTIQDDAGQILANAKCTLDSRMTRYSDLAGVVRFPISAIDDGLPHFVLIESEGRPPFEISLPV